MENVTQEKMKNISTVEVSYSFDDLEIKGVFGKDVYVKGKDCFYKDCIIKISRTLFKKSLDIWLNDKKEYCERCAGFCGAMGTIRSSDYMSVDPMEVLTEYNYTKNQWDNERLEVVEVYSIEAFTDMENG